MYRRLLVPLDGSELAEMVLPDAEEIGATFGTDIRVLHVCSSTESDMVHVHRAYTEHIAERVADRVKDILRTRMAHGDRRSITVESEVFGGHAAEGILSAADRHKSDIILMATHGRSGIRRWVMGSVADKVLRASPVPVLLVRVTVDAKSLKPHPRRILVPLDGSEFAEKALPHAEQLAKGWGMDTTELLLVRVFEPPTIPADYPPGMPLSWDEHVSLTIDHVRKMGRDYLEGIQSQIRQGAFKTRTKVLLGKASDEIVKYAEGNDVDLLVMTTHGYSGFTRWELGTVSDRVLHAISVPVLLVRSQE